MNCAKFEKATRLIRSSVASFSPPRSVVSSTRSCSIPIASAAGTCFSTAVYSWPESRQTTVVPPSAGLKCPVQDARCRRTAVSSWLARARRGAGGGASSGAAPAGAASSAAGASSGGSGNSAKRSVGSGSDGGSSARSGSDGCGGGAGGTAGSGRSGAGGGATGSTAAISAGAGGSAGKAGSSTAPGGSGTSVVTSSAMMSGDSRAPHCVDTVIDASSATAMPCPATDSSAARLRFKAGGRRTGVTVGCSASMGSVSRRGPAAGNWFAVSRCRAGQPGPWAAVFRL